MPLLSVLRIKSAVIDTGFVGNDGIASEIISYTHHSSISSLVVGVDVGWENVIA
jgi:hypothetical protein